MFSSRYGMQIFTVQLTSKAIDSEEICCVIPPVKYCLQLKQGKNEWKLIKRYSDFVKVHEKLKETFPNLTGDLPCLPPKTILLPAVMCSEAFQSERYTALGKYLDKLLLLLSEKNRLNADCPIVAFFELSPY